MQPLWLFIHFGRQFEAAFENAHSGEEPYLQMQPMWLCIFSVRQFEDLYLKLTIEKILGAIQQANDIFNKICKKSKSPTFLYDENVNMKNLRNMYENINMKKWSTEYLNMKMWNGKY